MRTRTELDHADAPGLWRAAFAAQRCGMTKELFLAACDAGELPFEVVRIGPRGFAYVRSADVEAFLQGDRAK